MSDILFKNIIAGAIVGAAISFAILYVRGVYAEPEPFVPTFIMCSKEVHIEGLREAWIKDYKVQLVWSMLDNPKYFMLDRYLGVRCA